MPELPEVETIKNTISQFLKNETFKCVEIFYKRMILSGAEDFVKRLIGLRILDIKRKGKYLLFYLSDDYIIISHLRMEGKFYLLNGNDPINKHTRILFTFESGKRVSYDDSRMFGIMKLIKKNELDKDPLLLKVGPEPFDIKDSDYLYNNYSKMSSPIKTAILDQSIMSGLGNIYADEVLFLSRINPKTLGKSIDKKDAKNILDNSIKVLNKAITLGGSTIRSYHSAKGVDGKFQNELLVYGKENEPCPVCGVPFKKIRVNGRGTTFCPHCQKLKKSSKVVALTGLIASGKSTALDYFKKHGYKTFNADKIVENLYKNKDVSLDLAKRLKKDILSGDDTISKDKLRQLILDNPKYKEKIEKFIHPLVEDILYKEIISDKYKNIAIEVPLLFEASLQYLADRVVALDLDKSQQKENLKKRGSNIKESLLIYNNSSFNKYKKYADYVIKTTSNVDDLYKNLDKVIKNLSES